jgi:hypothetical protein
MPLPTETASAETRRRTLAGILTIWNRRLHYYIGLYLLFFLWLFSFTGLLLNHPQWTFAEFWPNRTQSSFTRQIEPPPPGSDLSQAHSVMSQLGLRGEIEWTTTRSDMTRLDFRVSRPGHIFEVKTDLIQNRAAIQQIDLNAWGVIRILHTFTGVRLDDTKNQRDWILTSIWAFAMDAVALGSIVMVLGSLYMWWIQPQKRRMGLIAGGLGILSCGFFVFGLRWLF